MRHNLMTDRQRILLARLMKEKPGWVARNPSLEEQFTFLTVDLAKGYISDGIAAPSEKKEDK